MGKRYPARPLAMQAEKGPQNKEKREGPTKASLSLNQENVVLQPGDEPLLHGPGAGAEKGQDRNDDRGYQRGAVGR